MKYSASIMGMELGIIQTIEAARLELRIKKQDLAERARIRPCQYSNLIKRAQEKRRLHYPTIKRLVDVLLLLDPEAGTRESLEYIIGRRDEPIFSHRKGKETE